MLQCCPILKLMQCVNALIIQNSLTTLLHILKPRRINPLPRDEISGAEPTAQEISRNGVSERQRGQRVFGAEDDHVCEVHSNFGVGFFAVEAAGWEDGFYSSDGEARWVEADVAGIVLLGFG